MILQDFSYINKYQTIKPTRFLSIFLVKLHERTSLIFRPFRPLSYVNILKIILLVLCPVSFMLLWPLEVDVILLLRNI